MKATSIIYISAALALHAAAEESVLNKTSDAFQAWVAGQKLSLEGATAVQGPQVRFVPDASGTVLQNGWLPESIWKNAEGVKFVFLDGSGDTCQAPTTAKVLTCGGVLHFLFECSDPNAEHLVYSSTGRDSADLWRDDGIEILLRPGAERGPESLHIIVNPASGIYASGLSEVANRTLRRRCKILPGGWRTEISLPLRAVVADGDIPVAWCGNFSRSRKGREGANAEETAWRATGELRISVPENFGFLYLEAVEKKLPLPGIGDFELKGRDLLKLADNREEAADILRGAFQCPAAIAPLATTPDPGFSFWDHAAKLPLVPMYETVAGPAQQATARIYRDKNTLHLCVECAERDMGSIKAAEPKDAKNIWTDDSIEIFLAPERSESAEYRQIVVNAAGAIQINKGRKPSPLPGVEAHVEKKKDAWQVYVTVPFAAFNFADSKVPALWGMNFVRNRPARKSDPEETSVWSHPGAWTVHSPARFGSTWLEGCDALPELGTGEERALWAARGFALRPQQVTPRPEEEFNWDVISQNEKPELALTEMTARLLNKYVKDAFAERDKQWNAIKDWESWEKLKAQVRANFWRSIGTSPKEKFALNPRSSVVFEDEEIRCERLLYESRSRFYVSANLYTPKSQAGKKVPTVVFLTGHATRGRFTSLAQSEELARTGYVVLALDVLGQGERIDVNNGFGSRTPTSNHYEEGAACVLTGTNLAQYMIYDVMRGLDYLETRPEADMSRVVMTGASGGGTMTAYVAALDDRVAAAAPVSALGSSRGGGGNYDAEQVLYGGYPWALDCEGFLSLIAPRPAIVICEVSGDQAKRENMASYDVARKIYNLKGAGDKLEYVPTPGPHGYGSVHFTPFKEWLARTVPPNPGTPAYSRKKSKIPSDNYNATKSGNVFYTRELPGSETVYSLNTRAISLPLSYDVGVANGQQAAARAAEIVKSLRGLLALDEAEAAKPKATLRASESFDGISVEKWLLETEPGILVPAVLLKAKRDGKTPAVIWLAEHGKRSALQSRWPLLRDLVTAGVSVLLPDLRATGETCVDADDTFLGGEADLNGFSYRVARPLIGMRVHDALSCAAWLRSHEAIDPARVAIAGDSLSGFNPPQIRQPRLATDAELEPIEQAQSLGPAVALLAFALDGKLSCCATRGGLTSYSLICPQLYFMHPWSIFVPGILKVCDIPDICAAAAPRPLQLAGNVNAWNQKLDKAGISAAGYPRVERAYELAGAPAAILIDQTGDAAEMAKFMIGNLGNREK